MSNLAPTQDDPDATNFSSIVDLMDTLEELQPTFEADIQFDVPFELKIVDEEGNEAIIILKITAENYIPLSMITFGLALGIKASPYLMSKLAILIRSGVRIGFVSATGGLVSTAGFTSRITALSTRISIASTQVSARVANTAFGRFLTRYGGWFARIGGTVLLVDLLIFAATAIIRALDEIALATDDPSAWGKADRQAAISELIMEYDILWAHYNYDPTPAETYGLDYPFGASDLITRPYLYDYVTSIDVTEAFSEDMIDALLQSSLFVMIATWMGLGLQVISITVNLIESDVVYSSDSDVSQFISEYWADQQQKIYQDVINAFLADPYYLLELFIAALAAKTFYNTYLPHFASVFQTQNA